MEAAAIVIDTWLQPAGLRSRKISFKSKVSHSSECPRAAVLRLQKRMLKVLTSSSTSASEVGDPMPDFEHLLKIASGLSKISTGNFKKQVTTAEGKAKSERRSLTDRQSSWMIYDFLKISGDNGAILDFRDISKVQRKNGNVQACDKKGDEVSSAVTDRPTDNILESLYKMQVERSEEPEICVASLRPRDDIWRQEKYYCRLKFMVH